MQINYKGNSILSFGKRTCINLLKFDEKGPGALTTEEYNKIKENIPVEFRTQ